MFVVCVYMPEMSRVCHCIIQVEPYTLVCAWHVCVPSGKIRISSPIFASKTKLSVSDS